MGCGSPGSNGVPRETRAGRDTGSAKRAEESGVIGYLTSQYPAVSHTFIRREVAALRSLGLTVRTYSIRPAPLEELLTEADRDECRRTSSLQPCGPLRAAGILLGSMTRTPVRVLRTLWDAVRERPRGLRELLWAAFYFVEALLLAREIQRAGVRHLHCHFANAASQVGWLTSRYLGIPWSLMVHGSADFALPHVQTLPSKLRDARFVAFASFFGRAQGMRLVEPSTWGRFHVVRCGVDLHEHARRDSARDANSIREPGTIQLLCVARLSSVKGLWGLLEAFAICCTKRRDLSLTLVGEGPDRGMLEERVRELGLEDRTTFTGALAGAELRNHFLQADVFVMSSLMEGVPVVLMEAMLLEVPVIAPRLAGIPELVAHDRTGLLFTPGDWADLAEAMLRLSADAGLRQRLLTEARPHVLRHHDSLEAARPLLQLLQSAPRIVQPPSVLDPTR